MKPAAWVALLVLSAAAGARADRADDLARMRRAIEDSRARIAVYEREGRGLLEAMEAIDLSVSLLAREVAVATRSADRARERLAQVEAEASRLELSLAGTRVAMAQRAVALYKAGEAGALRLLFAAEGLREFLSRVQALRMLLAHDTDLIDRHRRQSEALADAEARARGAAAGREAALARLRERRGELGGEREAKRRLARRLSADRSRERSALAELETAARALEETLAALSDEAPRTGSSPSAIAFASLKGSLEPPVSAPVIRGFGRVVDEQFRTQTFRGGVEYGAPAGAPVRAVAAGVVRYAGWFRGYGRIVIVDHGEQYFSVSGHLESQQVAVGDELAAGDRLGAVGDTGSLTGAKLYFEIRKAGQALDPAEWLADPGGVE